MPPSMKKTLLFMFMAVTMVTSCLPHRDKAEHCAGGLLALWAASEIEKAEESGVKFAEELNAAAFFQAMKSQSDELGRPLKYSSYKYSMSTSTKEEYPVLTVKYRVRHERGNSRQLFSFSHNSETPRLCILKRHAIL